MVFMKLIEIGGTPYERGYKFGIKLKNKIKKCIEFQDKYWANKVSPNKVMKSYKENKKIFESFAPEILEEIRGLADAIKLEYKKFLIPSICSPYFLPFCSAFVALNNLTKNKKPIMGRNVDWLSESQKHIIYVFTKPDNGYKHICSRHLNSVGYYDGINEKGLAITWTGIFTFESETAPGLLMFFITKLVLEKCSNIKEAIKLIKKIPIANSINFIILDKNEAAIIETTSKHRIVKKLRKNENFLIITNSFMSQKMKKYDIAYVKWPKLTDPRFQRYTKLIKENEGLIDVELTKKILSDHEGFICAHSKRRQKKWNTISSFIALPESKIAFYVNGNPCKNKFFKFSI